ncbi:MAG: dihydrofolate reductase family protein [Actinomycetota bacterium]|nr:dihydrofolate reductase family protein [Actinomycetota bacterium]
MGKIVSNFFISLDGVVESPDQWHFPYFNDEMGAAIDAGVQSCEAFLMGRVLYEEWAEYWPSQGDDVPFASFINTVPKYVVSDTLTEAAWNNTTLVTGDVATGCRRSSTGRTATSRCRAARRLACCTSPTHRRSADPAAPSGG